jgi:15-cis-phytoene synthase
MDWVAQIADPERRLALSYAPREKRQALALLWALDERLGAIVAATREETLGQIRLAWWRDALAALAERAPAGEPLLEALFPIVQAGTLFPAELARLPEGWTVLLAPTPFGTEVLEAHAKERGATLFGLSSAILGCTHGVIEGAGSAWALIDLGARVSDARTAQVARLRAGERLSAMEPGRLPKPLRPLAVLTALARHDQRAGFPRRQGSPKRLAIALKAGMLGR